ncbi:MAG: MBG domain-containing protein [Faecalibacillus faecis]
MNDASKTYGDEDSEFTYVNDKLIGNDKLTELFLQEKKEKM